MAYAIGITEPIAVFRLQINPSAIGKPPGSVFDLVLGKNAKADAVVLCTHDINVKPLPAGNST